MRVEYKRLIEAQKDGYIPYSGPYKSVTEAWMVDNALKDIERNHRDMPCLVKIAQTIEIHIRPNYYGYQSHIPPYKRNEEIETESSQQGPEENSTQEAI